MSKVIKQMEMDALKKNFNGVKNMVLLSQGKLGAIAENQLRLGLRKKNIRLQMVKNSLARKVFSEMGLELKDVWAGNTVIAWGGGESVKDLSKELEAAFRDQTKKDPKFGEKLKVKAAVAEGEQVTFEAALKMPTRLEAIGEIVGMILSPGSAIAGCLTAPGGAVASQIESKSKEEAAPATA
jgi:large subunit ribosomal protein L10